MHNCNHFGDMTLVYEKVLQCVSFARQGSKGGGHTTSFSATNQKKAKLPSKPGVLYLCHSHISLEGCDFFIIQWKFLGDTFSPGAKVSSKWVCATLTTHLCRQNGQYGNHEISPHRQSWWACFIRLRKHLLPITEASTSPHQSYHFHFNNCMASVSLQRPWSCMLKCFLQSAGLGNPGRKASSCPHSRPRLSMTLV